MHVGFGSCAMSGNAMVTTLKTTTLRAILRFCIEVSSFLTSGPRTSYARPLLDTMNLAGATRAGIA